MEKEQSPFRQAVDNFGRRLQKTQSAFDLVQAYIKINRIPLANETAFDLEAQCEKLTTLARSLPFYTGDPRSRSRMEKSIMRAVPVDIGFTGEGWFRMRFPALLPRKRHGSTDYIRESLYPAMYRFFADRPRFHYSDCVIIFRHLYDRRRPERQYRDHDNIELNEVVNLISQFLLDGDAPLLCFHFYMSEAADADATETIVLPQSDFICWLVGEKFSQNRVNPDHKSSSQTHENLTYETPFFEPPKKRKAFTAGTP